MYKMVMCKKYHCIKAKECYRLRASPNKEQLYADFLAICNEEDNYHLFMRIRPEDNVIEIPNIGILDLKDTN